MSYKEWEDALRKELSDLTPGEREEVIRYYAEIYGDKHELGLSDEEILIEFGIPEDCARKIREGREIPENKDSTENSEDTAQDNGNTEAEPEEAHTEEAAVTEEAPAAESEEQVIEEAEAAPEEGTDSETEAENNEEEPPSTSENEASEEAIEETPSESEEPCAEEVRENVEEEPASEPAAAAVPAESPEASSDSETSEEASQSEDTPKAEEQSNPLPEIENPKKKVDGLLIFSQVLLWIFVLTPVIVTFSAIVLCLTGSIAATVFGLTVSVLTFFGGGTLGAIFANFGLGMGIAGLGIILTTLFIPVVRFAFSLLRKCLKLTKGKEDEAA